MNGRVLITGASGALGRSVVQRFLAAGERVLAVGTDESALAELAPLAPSDSLSLRRADLTDSGEVARLFADAESASGTFPAVVHLVGGFRFARLAEMSDKDWSFLVSVNLETTFRVFRESARAFERARAGALVAVAAPAGLLGEAGVGGYAATKAGMLRLVESFARELAPFGARANAVLPGTMDTPANRAAMPAADPSQWVSTAAVAEIIHFLTTPAATAANGAAVRVPGPSL
ncbi:MAG TPA: SDR family NAD(P)-dependent oxidoreductase [Thermoanaerobaculia bacterium]|jgi:NAD(P)-dependent dehydrogenase (short-subunit alcohol dehydrogenase family)|nr:SDR family NAD(P)-dependent oxidoreductase [Thermoanaerobaculia bacterium]